MLAPPWGQCEEREGEQGMPCARHGRCQICAKGLLLPYGARPRSWGGRGGLRHSWLGRLSGFGGRGSPEVSLLGTKVQQHVILVNLDIGRRAGPSPMPDQGPVGPAGI